MKMKNRWRQFFNQQNPLDGRSITINGPWVWIKEYPVIFLWLLWLSYLLIDYMIRILGNMAIAPLWVVAWNFFGWGIINQFTFFVFLPNIVFRKKWKVELPTLLTIFSLYIIVKFLLHTLYQNLEIEFIPFLLNEVARSVQFLLNTLAIWGFYVLAISQDKLMQIEVNLIRLKIEHKSLQLSPHFTLNMLSQFSAKILNLSRDLFQPMSNFNEVLSYSFKNLTTQNTLAQEIHAMESYLECQKFRFGEKLQFRLIKDFNRTMAMQLPLPKWTLMTMLENVFKHGDCFQKNNPCFMAIKISSTRNNRLFSLSLYNPVDTQNGSKSSGFGIDAVERILNYYHPDRFYLFIEKNSIEFSLLIYIDYGTNFENRPIG